LVGSLPSPILLFLPILNAIVMSDYKEDPLVSNLVPNPAEVPETIVLTGFVGHGAQKDRLRVYVDAELSEYLEVSTSDVLYQQEGPIPQSPLKSSLVWVKASAQVRHVRTRAEKIEAEFLQGNITSTLLRGTDSGGIGVSTVGEKGPIGSIFFTAWNLCCTKYRPINRSCADLCTEVRHITPDAPC